MIADTDIDGVNDGLEIAAGTDPLNNASTPILNNGDANNVGLVNAGDMLIAQRILTGQLMITSLQLARLDVAPLEAGVPAPDGMFDFSDYLVLIRKVTGNIDF